MLISDIEKFKSTGSRELESWVNPETGENIKVETFFDAKGKKVYEVDRGGKRYRQSNVIGQFGEWTKEKDDRRF